MNRYRQYKNDKIINKILENHFSEFRETKWHRVRKEMLEHIINIVERAYFISHQIFKNEYHIKKHRINKPHMLINLI